MKLSKVFSKPVVAAGIGTLVLLFARPAWANNPPGPQMTLAEILILPIMIIFTMLGGGYAILQAGRENPRRKGRWKILMAIIMIIVSGVSEGIGMLVMIIFGIIALVRGLEMVWWGLSALRQKEERKPRLVTANPIRLMPAGIILAVAAIGLGGIGPAFVGWYPERNVSRTELDLKDLIAYQLLMAKEHTGTEGAPVYQPPISDEKGSFSKAHPSFERIEFSSLNWGEGNRFRHYQTDFQLGPSGKSFQVRVIPYGFPFFPYRYFVSLPSFYGDQTGAIRMIRVNHAGQKCPEDAPVYYQVGKDDLKRVAERLRPAKSP